jgi:PEP-CTERM motif
MTRGIVLIWLLSLFAVAAPIASADGVTWTIEDLTLSDGASVTGSFVYDATTNTFSSIDIVTQAGTALNGTAFPGATYTVVDPGFGPFPFDVAFVPSASDLTNGPVLELEFFAGSDENATESLTNAGGTVVTVVNELQCSNVNCSSVYGQEIRGSNVDSPTGIVVGVPTPEPSTLLLMGSGLLFVGPLFATRRHPPED